MGAAVLGACLVTSACGTGGSASPAKVAPGLTVAGPAPSEPPATVGFAASDGIQITGRWYGRGTTVIALAHMGNDENSQDDWRPLATVLVSNGYSVLTFNRRGVCSADGACSAGPSGYAGADDDVLGAIAFARAQGGAKVVAGGASIGAMSSLYAVAHEHAAVDGLIWIAGAVSDSYYSVDAAEVGTVHAPMLIISTVDDRFGVGPDASTLASWANEPKTLDLVPGRQHGTELWTAGSAAQQADLNAVVLAFLRSLGT